MKFSRQFRLPGGGRIIVGRNRMDNQTLKGLQKEGRLILHTVNIPGPTAAVLGEISEDDLQLAASIISDYGDKGALTEIIVKVIAPDNAVREITVNPLARETYQPWML
jgi:hypothetical protein